MRFAPKSDEDLQKESSKFLPWPNGVYDFEVAEAEDKTSAKGNEMLVLTLHVFNTEGDRRTVFDYLLESIPHKLKHAAEACGLHSQYQSGQIDKHDFYGKTGRVKLGIQPGKDGYQAKNVVRDYIGAKVATDATRHSAKAASPFQPACGNGLDDDIPF